MKRERFSPVLLVAVFANLLLFFIKLYIGLRTNSLGIYTDSMNNLADTLTACLGLLGLFFVSAKATQAYPYGFGRLEAFTSFLMALAMTAAGCTFAYNSLERFFAPVPIWFSSKYALILFATCLAKLALGAMFRIDRKKKKRDSIIFKTMELDSFLDFFVTLATLISFTLTNYIDFAVDSVLGLVISILIAVAGVKMICSTAGDLLGREQPELKAQIHSILEAAYPGLEITRLRLHNYGRNVNFAELTVRDPSAAYRQNGCAVLIDMKKRLEGALPLSSTVEWEE